MKYYKIVLNNEIIGAISSSNFIKFSPITESFLRSNETEGEFINWKGQIYRDTWMKPVPFEIDFIQALILNITEEEYNILIETFETHEQIIINNDDDFIEPEIPEPVEDPDITLEFVRASKIKEMSTACRNTIENGFDLELRGATRHFSLTTQDQLNLMSCSRQFDNFYALPPRQ